MTRKPNFAKFILGGVVLALLFIGTLATVRTPRTSAAKGTITTNMLGVAVGMPSPVPTPTPPPVPVHVGNVFQIDGNAADGTPSTGTDDWNDYDPPISTVSDASSGSVTGPFGHSVIATFVSDPSISTDLIYTGGGSKDFNDIQPSWSQVPKGTGPAKDDVEHAFAAKYISNLASPGTPCTPGGPSSTCHEVLVFGGDRPTTNGDANIGFWFFQNNVFPVTSGANTGTFSGFHKNGDVFVLSAFSGGGGTSTIRVLSWVGTPSVPTDPLGTGGFARCQAYGTGAFIDSASVTNAPDGTLCDITGTASNPGAGITNTADASIQWQYYNKDNKSDCTTVPCTIPAQDFYEGGIDLSTLNLQGECFASFLLESRSSQSVSAVLKDFALGGFNTCAALSVSKTGSGEACVGNPASYTYSVSNTGASSLDVSLLDDAGTTGDATDDFYVSGLATGGGTCVITAASPPPGSIPTSNIAAGATKSCTLSGVFLAAGTITNHVHAHGVDPVFGGTADADSMATVIRDPNPSLAVSPHSTEVCAGGTRTFTATPSGGSGIYGTITWTGPGGFTATGSSITVSVAGDYTAHVTDSNTCPAQDTGTLIVNPNPTCSVSPATQAVCVGGSATFTVNPSGGTPPYGTITWAGPNSFSATGTSITINNAQTVNAGTYTASFTDAKGCMTSCSGTLTVNPNPTVAVTSETCTTGNGAGNLDFIVLHANPSGGTGPYTFSWVGSGNASGFTSTDQNPTASKTGTYTVTVTDANTCVSPSASLRVGLCASAP